LPIPAQGTLMITLPPEISYDYISTIKYTGRVNMIPNVIVKKGKNA